MVRRVDSISVIRPWKTLPVDVCQLPPDSCSWSHFKGRKAQMGYVCCEHSQDFARLKINICTSTIFYQPLATPAFGHT